MIKKIIKILLAIVGIIVLLVVALAASLPLWFGPVVKPVVNSTVPQLTKTPFNLGKLSLNPYTGRFELGEVFLANPANYSEQCAVRIGSLVFDVEPTSLATDVIHIEEVTISDVFVSIVYADRKTNFTQLQCNVTNSLKLAASEPQQEVSAEEKDELEEISNKKVIIDRLSLSGLKLHIGLITLPVPPLTLTDIGKTSNGATWTQLWEQIVAAVMKSSGAVGNAFNAAGGKVLTIGNDALDVGKQGLDSALESAKKMDFKTAEKALKDSHEKLKQSGDALKNVGESLKGLFN